MSQTPRTTPRASPPPPALELDPAAPGTVIRVALVIESLFNLIFALPLALSPHQTFRQYFLPDDDDDAAAAAAAATSNGQQRPAPEAASLAQAYAVVILGITAGMLLSVPNRPGAVEWRRMFYANSLVTELMYAPLTFWQAWVLGAEGSGMDPGKLVKFTGVPLAGLAAWRVWVFLVKPEWFGRYRVAAQKAD